MKVSQVNDSGTLRIGGVRTLPIELGTILSALLIAVLSAGELDYDACVYATLVSGSAVNGSRTGSSIGGEMYVLLNGRSML